MNFKGRYRTRNGTLVAVHSFSNERQEIRVNAYWWGHELRLKAPWKDDRVFYWDELGNCVAAVGKPKDLDLMERVSGKDCLEAKIECVDCEECRKERKG